MSCVIDLIKNYPNLINVFAIIIGWWIINRQNNRRETRKEVRTSINDIQAMVSGIERSALNFHSSVYNEENKSRLIFDFRVMSVRAELTTSVLGVDLNQQITDLRHSIMTTNWDKGEFKPVDVSDDLLKTISLKSHELSDELEKVFFDQYYKTKGWVSFFH